MARTGRPRTDAVLRFWSYVKKTPTCWLWTGPMWGDGYARMKIGPKEFSAHVFSYTLHYGAPKLHVLHTCDVRHCVNPAHLWEGTHRQNVDDMVAKGRSLRGERHSLVKLTRKQVLIAKTSSIPAHVLAERWGVSPGAIYNIRSGLSWKWV